jgi:ParB family transcriptional regulator, chromosome partitioning protein
MRGVCAETPATKEKTMSNRQNLPAKARKIVLVPLGKLKKSPKNVRKILHAKTDIQSLAASIAALGMLQYPVVEPEVGPRGKETGCYLVNAGEGRRLAQLLRVKRKEIKADEPIPCLLDTEHGATEISLAENAVRCDMHPADQYEAFAKLHGEEGMSAEDISWSRPPTRHVSAPRCGPRPAGRVLQIRRTSL